MASIDYQMLEASKLRVVVQGRLDVETTEPLWRQAKNAVKKVYSRFLT